jgi:hypothetical protein
VAGQLDRKAVKAVAASAAGSPADAVGNRSKPASPADVTVEERLRRMEEAYLRMERSNQRIQSQYDTLLRKYEDLSKKVSTDKSVGSPSPTRARTVSRGAASATLSNRRPRPSRPGRPMSKARMAKPHRFP